MLSTEVSGVSSCISQRCCNYRTCSRLRLSRIFLATTALRHTGLQSKTECRSSISPTYSKQEARRRKLHYLKAEFAKSWSAWRWGADRNWDTRVQRQSERRRNWDGYGDRDSKLHVEKEVKRFRDSRKEKKIQKSCWNVGDCEKDWRIHLVWVRDWCWTSVYREIYGGEGKGARRDRTD